MGLTIHYQLSLDASLSIREVKAKLEALRQACLDLPFAEVSKKMWDVKKCHFEDYRNDEENADLFWALIQSQANAHYAVVYDEVIQSKEGERLDGTNYSVGVTPKRFVGFMAWPGEGCEPANVGMRILPKSHTVKSKDVFGRDIKGRLKIPEAYYWSWSSFCKTQYALNVSPEHFLQCHLTVIRMLDKSKELGFGVEVSDEGEYWEKRDIQLLLKNADENLSMIAAFAGALKDKIALEAPVLDNKQFERLEMKGQGDVTQKLKKLILQTGGKLEQTDEKA